MSWVDACIYSLLGRGGQWQTCEETVMPVGKGWRNSYHAAIDMGKPGATYLLMATMVAKGAVYPSSLVLCFSFSVNNC